MIYQTRFKNVQNNNIEYHFEKTTSCRTPLSHLEHLLWYRITPCPCKASHLEPPPRYEEYSARKHILVQRFDFFSQLSEGLWNDTMGTAPRFRTSHYVCYEWLHSSTRWKNEFFVIRMSKSKHELPPPDATFVYICRLTRSGIQLK